MDNTAEILSINNGIKSGVTRLTLTDFRNYAHLRLNAELAPIVITGENGSGKTNILEAISFLTPGRGLRSADCQTSGALRRVWWIANMPRPK